MLVKKKRGGNIRHRNRRTYSRLGGRDYPSLFRRRSAESHKFRVLEGARGSLNYHVDIENRHTGRQVVLVKDTCEFVVDEGGALFESPAAPRVKRATLKLTHFP